MATTKHTRALTPRDYDNDRTYQNPRAWATTKRAFGDGYEIRELLLRLEDVCVQNPRACPRRLLAVALFDFLRRDPEVRGAADIDFWDWLQAQKLTREERDASRRALRMIIIQDERDGPRAAAA